MRKVIPASSDLPSFRGQIKLVGNEHFKGAKNMAVDVRGIEDLTSAVADKFKLTSEFVLTCWDLDHEKDVWLDDNNMLKVSGA